MEAALRRAGSLPPAPATMTIPAGAVGVPVHWHAACDGRLLCLALPPGSNQGECAGCREGERREYM